MKRFSIYDVKAEAWMPPFYRLTNGIALREFQTMSNDPGSIFGKHPADFTLFDLGEWNEFTCEDKPNTTKVPLANGLELQNENNNQEPTPMTPIQIHRENDKNG